mmetsp:Transcript_8639/g.29670  ORF Transcript_8639/g.29670 Transcript_8639/m.29670 type:complete len:260 (-) Transcript_8639:288-1067(-)
MKELLFRGGLPSVEDSARSLLKVVLKGGVDPVADLLLDVLRHGDVPEVDLHDGLAQFVALDRAKDLAVAHAGHLPLPGESEEHLGALAELGLPHVLHDVPVLLLLSLLLHFRQQDLVELGDHDPGLEPGEGDDEPQNAGHALHGDERPAEVLVLVQGARLARLEGAELASHLGGLHVHADRVDPELHGHEGLGAQPCANEGERRDPVDLWQGQGHGGPRLGLQLPPVRRVRGRRPGEFQAAPLGREVLLPLAHVLLGVG